MRKILLLGLMCAACDPQAKGSAAAAHPATPSRIYESCAATSDCDEKLRCVANVCRTMDTSRIGEFHWAAGQDAFDKNQIPQAAESLRKALATFETDKKEVPPGLLVDYGAALRKKGDSKSLELAARVLHRAILTAPFGSPEHTRAFREVAELEAQGLDPTLIARDAPTDGYLPSGAQVAPQVTGLKIEVARTTPASDKGYEGWAKLIEGGAGAASDALLKCFTDYTTKTQKPKLILAMPLKLHARLGDDDIYEGGTLDVLPDPAAKGDEAAANTCVKTALTQTAVDFAKSGSSDSWSGTITLTLSGS
jgi:hypothetical protein